MSDCDNSGQGRSNIITMVMRGHFQSICIRGWRSIECVQIENVAGNYYTAVTEKHHMINGSLFTTRDYLQIFKWYRVLGASCEIKDVSIHHFPLHPPLSTPPTIFHHQVDG